MSFLRSGRGIVVPYTEIKSKAPMILESLVALETTRRHAVGDDTADDEEELA